MIAGFRDTHCRFELWTEDLAAPKRLTPRARISLPDAILGGEGLTIAGRQGATVEFNLADLFESVVDAIGTETAVVADARRLTYAELEARANRLAHYLSGAGVGAGDFVGVQLANGSEYLETMLACFKIRAVPVNVNYRYVADELRYLYRDAGLVGLIFHGRFGQDVVSAADEIGEPHVMLQVDDAGYQHRGFAERYEAAISTHSSARDFGPRSADDRYCVYTGGTTGMPKGVLWRHEDIFFAGMGGGDPIGLGNVVTRPEELAERLAPPGLVAIASSPFMHASGHWLAFTMLFGGGRVVTLPGGHFDPAALWRLVDTEQANIIVVVGDAVALPLLEWYEAHPGASETSSLLAFGSGGAPLSPSTKRRLAADLPGCIVIDAFGSSETGQLGGHAPEGDAYGAPRLQVDARTNVLDANLSTVLPGSGVIGHLARSGHIPLGYLGDPKKTVETFVEAEGHRWVLPGDMATVDQDGTIVILGRGSLCINTGGEKVFPDEVEAAVREFHDVADVVVVGVPDERYGERVAAIVQSRVGSDIDPEALRAMCRKHLADYKVPRVIVAADTISRTPAGKVDYQWAKAFALDAPDSPH